MSMTNHIKAAREARGLCQEELADAVQTSRENICRYERGKRTPSLETAFRLASCLDMTVDQLFRLEKP